MEENKSSIDFSGLLDSDFVNFETAASAAPQGGRRVSKSFGNRSFRGNNAPRERREFRKNDRNNGETRGNGMPRERRDFGGRRKKSFGKPAFRQPPAPVATLNFYPENKPITALVNAIKSSCRAYTLFEIANLLLEKPERFNVVIAPIAPKDGTPARPLTVSVPDNMPFIRENDAMEHALALSFGDFFDIAESEVPAPKGEYKLVTFCSIDNGVISAPNYHGYARAVHDYYAKHFSDMPFEKFAGTLKTSSDEVLVKSWLESMTKRTVYILKERAEGEPEQFDSETAAADFLRNHRREKLVADWPQWRIPGTMIEKLPKGRLRAQIESELAKQRKFPLETANGFRGRLRHMGLWFFRKTPENITVVSGTRRKFRTPSTRFSDEIQRIFDFLDKNSGSKLDALIAALLGENASDEDKTKLAGALHWLVVEGYVCEMGSGELSVFPVMSEEQAKAAENNEKPKEREALEIVEDESGIAANVPARPETIVPADDFPATEEAVPGSGAVPAAE